MTKDELIDEIAMIIGVGIMLGQDTHEIAEALYEGFIQKEGEHEPSTEVR
jgi:hypothetical protein